MIERSRPSQSPRDRILWVLTNHDGRMERGRLRRCAGIKCADLDPILSELAREGKIKISGPARVILWITS